MQIYVGTYAKYNAGSIAGAWFKVADYADAEDFYQAIRQHHGNETDPEFMFQDWEDIPDQLISESWVSDAVFTHANELEDFEPHHWLALAHFMDCGKSPGEAVSLVSEAHIYEGRLDHWAMDDIQMFHDIPESLDGYIDYEAWARDAYSNSRVLPLFNHGANPLNWITSESAVWLIDAEA